MSWWLAMVCGALVYMVASRRSDRRRARLLVGGEAPGRPRSRDRTFLALASGRRREGSGEWPEVMRQLGTLLRAGETTHAVWGLVASGYGASAREPSTPQDRERDEVAGFLEHMARVTSTGLDPLIGLRTAAVRLPVSRRTVSTLRVSWRLAQRTGAPLGDVLTRMAEALDDEIHASDARDSAVAGPRATARILATLPVIGLGLGALLGTNPWGVITGTPWGRASFLCGAILALGGALWSRRLVRAAVSGAFGGTPEAHAPRGGAPSRAHRTWSPRTSRAGLRGIRGSA